MISTLKVAVVMTILGSSSTAFAAPPCEPGSKEGEQGTCSWTCTDGVYNISCVGGSGTGEHCYVHDTNTDVVCSASCDDYQCSTIINTNPLDMLNVSSAVDLESAGDETTRDPAPSRDATEPTRRR